MRTLSDSYTEEPCNIAERVNPVQFTEEPTRLDKMEATLQILSELLALNTRCQDPPQCFSCEKHGHVAKNCRMRRAVPMTVTCFKCGIQGNLAYHCRSSQQGNEQGGTPTQLAGGAPRQW